MHLFAICSNQWSTCLHYCPQPCTEPKSVSTYQVWTPTSYAYFGTSGCFSPFHPSSYGTTYEYRYMYYTVTTYQRTEHCDGSYTIVQTGQYNTSGWCWWETYWSCGPTTGYVPYGQLCP